VRNNVKVCTCINLLFCGFFSEQNRKDERERDKGNVRRPRRSLRTAACPCSYVLKIDVVLLQGMSTGPHLDYKECRDIRLSATGQERDWTCWTVYCCPSEDVSL
jgi:hypothetical protein